jgi:hypothetical protein
MKPLSQKGATEWGYALLKDAPLSEEARGYIESSLPYIVQKYYQAGGAVVQPGRETKAEWNARMTAGEIKKMADDGVIY